MKKTLSIAFGEFLNYMEIPSATEIISLFHQSILNCLVAIKDNVGLLTKVDSEDWAIFVAQL